MVDTTLLLEAEQFFKLYQGHCTDKALSTRFDDEQVQELFREDVIKPVTPQEWVWVGRP